MYSVQRAVFSQIHSSCNQQKCLLETKLIRLGISWKSVKTNFSVTAHGEGVPSPTLPLTQTHRNIFAQFTKARIVHLLHAAMSTQTPKLKSVYSGPFVSCYLPADGEKTHSFISWHLQFRDTQYALHNLKHRVL